MKTIPKIKAELVVLVNKLHRIGGWIVLIIAWIQIIMISKKGKLVFVILLNLISFGLFLLFKFKLKKKAQQTALTNPHSDYSNSAKLKIVHSSN